MSAILTFDFQKRKQLRFSEVNYLNFTKKDPILHVATSFSLKQGETKTSHGPIPHPLMGNCTSNQAILCTISELIIITFFENDISILKEIVSKTKILHW